MTEAIILFCTIFGTIITYLAFKNSTTDALKETKKLTLEKMEFLERLNTDLLKDLQEYGRSNQSFNSVFMQGLTLQQCIDILTKIKEGVLIDENYTALKKTKSKMRIDDIAKSIDIQIAQHSEVRTQFDYFIK
jgi:hypothetical protein